MYFGWVLRILKNHDLGGGDSGIDQQKNPRLEFSVY